MATARTWFQRIFRGLVHVWDTANDVEANDHGTLEFPDADLTYDVPNDRIVLRFPIATLTEPGASPPSAGFVRLVSASAGIYGGTPSSANAKLLGWDGANGFITVGDGTNVVYWTLATTAGATIQVAGQNRFNADDTATTISSPDGGGAVISSTDTDMTIAVASSLTCIVASQLRIGLDVTTSIVSSPDGTGRLALDNTDAILSGSTTVQLKAGGSAIVTVNASRVAVTQPAALASYLDLAAISAPAAPSAGTIRVYHDTADGKLKFKDSGGTVHVVTTIP